GLPRGVTLTAIRPERAGQLMEVTQSLAGALRADLDSQLPAIWDAQRASHAFKFRLYDLASFCRALGAHSAATPVVREAAQQVLAALADPAFLLAEEHTSPAYDDVGGL